MSIDTTTSSDRVLHGDNPFDVDPRSDLLHEIPESVPGWSETMFFHAWSPDSGVGVFIHCGRWPTDLDLWWAQVIALLPDGRLLVDRSWGRSGGGAGPTTGNLRIECLEPLSSWRLRFDGAGEITDLAGMAAGPSGAGPAVPFAFDLILEAAAPVWDMQAALGTRDLSWAAFHHTQGFRSSGELRSRDSSWNMGGVGIRDHSSGPRDVSALGGLHFFVFVFPDTGRVVNGLVNWDREGVVDHRTFASQQDFRCTVGSDVHCTGLEDYRTHRPHDMTVTLGFDGSDHVLTAQRLHGYTLTFHSPNENINGVDLRTQTDALVITQSTVRVVDPAGNVGYGVVERDYRPSSLPSPEER